MPHLLQINSGLVNLKIFIWKIQEQLMKKTSL